MIRPVRPDDREVQRISVSRATTIQTCSLRHAYRYVQRLPEETRGAALVVGSVLDVCAKRVVTGVQAGEFDVGSVPHADLFQSAWVEEEGRTQVPILWGAKGREAVQETAARLFESFCRLSDLPERIKSIAATDLHFEMPLHDPVHRVEVPGVVVIGVLDFVQRLPDGRLRMLELKTAANKGAYGADLDLNLQAGVYQAALRHLHGDEQVSPHAAWWVGLKTKAADWLDREVEVTASAETRAWLVLRHAWNAMQAGTAYPQPNLFCGGCSYAQACRTWHERPEAAPAHDPFAADLIGFPRRDTGS